MECRLCLRLVTEQSSVPIIGDHNLVEEGIWNCCKLRVTKYDELPSRMCLLCDSNLKSLMAFKTMSFQSDAKARLTLAESTNIKVEEVEPDDLVWDDEALNSNYLADQSSVGEIDLKPIAMCNVSSSEQGYPMTNDPSPHLTEIHKCDKCSIFFVTKNQLTVHMKLHPEERLHKCGICSKCFTTEKVFTKHLKSHTENMQHKRNDCYTSYVNNTDFSLHMKRLTGEKCKNDTCSKRFASKTWKYECTFSSEEEAKSFIDAEHCWSLKNTNNTEKGIIKYYRCNKVLCRGVQCDSVLKLIFDSASTDIVLHRTKANHNCDSINTKSDVGLSMEIKSDIEDLYTKKFKPKAIMDNLAEKYANPPNITQVKNYLAQFKRSLYGPSTLSLGDLEKWLNINGTMPSDDHKSFIINYMIDKSEGGVFRFIASSKALLKLALQDNFIIHADATYKLIWQGFPVLVIGTSDRNKKFHILAVAVCSDEQTADFEFVFRSLKETVKKIYDFELRIKVLVADASHSIKNGFENTFGTDAVIRMCWAHMRRAVYKNVQVLVEKIHVDKILADIDAIQVSENQYTFIKAYELFLKKWENEPIFLQYFQTEWYHKNRNWYEGACRGTPSTNNGLESTNRIIKDDYTLRERLPFPRFCHLLMEMVEAFSKKYENGQEFSNNVLIDLQTWTSAYHWAQLDKKIKAVSDGAKEIYLIPSGEYNEISENLLEETEDNLDEYLKKKGSYYTLTLPIDNDKWKDGECTCPAFLKNYMCKHLLGIAIRLKFVRPPLEAKNLEIGMKRKRGRPPSKAKRALIVQ